MYFESWYYQFLQNGFKKPYPKMYPMCLPDSTLCFTGCMVRDATTTCAACDCSSLGRECWFLRQDIDQMMKVQKQPLARFYGTYLLIKRCNPMT